MQSDLQNMFRKVVNFDMILTIIVLLVTKFIFKEYSLIILMGLAISLINFILNGIITEYLILNKRDSYLSLNFLWFVFRVIFVCIIAIILFQYNKFNVFAYMLGYSLQFISLTVYGLGMKNK